MRILSVVGARPQLVKLAPVADATRDLGVEHRIVHTGQHYDPMLSDVFFDDLGIPAPDVHLGVGSGGHGEQTGAMLARMDAVLDEQQPDWVLVYGDTNSTLAGTLSAVKKHVPVAHLEAGLRSFNRRMPEEHNRVLTDHAADLLLAPTAVAMGHLADEGLADRAVKVGDVMLDVLMTVRALVRTDPPAGTDLGVGVEPGGYSVATIHRAENTDDPARLRAVVDGLAQVGHPVVLLAHPRLRARAEQHGIDLNAGSVVARNPLAYPALVAAVDAARGVITDSGGLQKEAFALRVPCTTVRTETEWTETVDLGWNVLVEPGTALTDAAQRPAPPATDATPYGDGHAARRAVQAILDAGAAPAVG